MSHWEWCMGSLFLLFFDRINFFHRISNDSFLSRERFDQAIFLYFWFFFFLRNSEYVNFEGFRIVKIELISKLDVDGNVWKYLKFLFLFYSILFYSYFYSISIFIYLLRFDNWYHWSRKLCWKFRNIFLLEISRINFSFINKIYFD